jgi:hypothetical protein
MPSPNQRVGVVAEDACDSRADVGDCPVGVEDRDEIVHLLDERPIPPGLLWLGAVVRRLVVYYALYSQQPGIRYETRRYLQLKQHPF